MNNDGDLIWIFLAGALLAVILVVPVTVNMVSSFFEESAVDNGAEYWCIVDHKKQFSWEPCDE